jgi:valyl-tRNA synthetase
MPGSEGLMAVHAPPLAPGSADEGAEAEIAAVQEVVSALRTYRSTRGLPPRTRLAMDPAPAPAVVALDPVEAADEAARATLVATLLPGGRSISVGPLADAVDPEVERTRLEDELRKAESEHDRAGRKLGDARFVERAPAHLVDAEREKAARYAAERVAIAARIAALG